MAFIKKEGLAAAFPHPLGFTPLPQFAAFPSVSYDVGETRTSILRDGDRRSTVQNNAIDKISRRH
jgi:hypothetical protein